MTEDTGGGGAPNGSPSAAPTHTVPSESGVTQHNPAAQAQWDDMSRSPDFIAKFSGNQGRAAQQEAVRQKSELLRAASGGETNDAMPAHLKPLLDHPDGRTRAAAENMIPASDMSEYNFKWANQSKMPLGTINELNTVAKEAAFSVNAPAKLTNETVNFIEQRINRADNVPESDAAVMETLTGLYGDKAGSTATTAKSIVDRMPESGRKAVRNAFARMDAKTGAWFISRLASLDRLK